MSELINSIASAILLMLAVVFSHRSLEQTVCNYPRSRSKFGLTQNERKSIQFGDSQGCRLTLAHAYATIKTCWQ